MTQINLTWYSNYTLDMAVSFQNDTNLYPTFKLLRASEALQINWDCIDIDLVYM